MNLPFTTFNYDSLPASSLKDVWRHYDDLSPVYLHTDLFLQETDSLSKESTNHLSFFTEHKQHHRSLKERFSERSADPNFHPFLIISVAFMLIISAKALYWKSFGQLYESLISMIKFRLWMRDTGSLLGSLFIFTTPAYLLIISLAVDFLVQMNFFATYEFNFTRYIAILIIISLFFGIRYLLMRLSAFIYASSSAVDEQIRNIQVHNTLLLFFLILILPLSIYMPDLFFPKIIIPFAVIIEVIRIARGLITAKTLKQYSIYYFFLYFCTVEILPVLIIIKTSIVLVINKL